MQFCTHGLRLALLGPVAALGLSMGPCDSEEAPFVLNSGAGQAALSPIAVIGKLIFNDPSLSASGRMSCETCHQPEHAHAGPPTDKVALGGPRLDLAGMRNAPSIRYASFTPPFRFDEEGKPVGGFFRDGRAKDLAEQARHPFLDEREMANPDAASLVEKLGRASYAAAFRKLFGEDVLGDSTRAFDSMVGALAAYEAESRDFHPFDSKYDAYLAGKARLTEQEERGRRLFNDAKKGNCAACHPSARGSDGSPPLFTDFTYDNIGLPREAAIERNRDPAFFDLGLCGPKRSDLAARREFCGAFKVPTLRNVARTAPYFHNGSFATLREVIDFYVRRDTNPEDWYPHAAGGVLKFNDLPSELYANVNVDEVPYDRKPGDEPALSPGEIDDVVAFLMTLDDGYRP
jgi:cytochrome c peroxidase